MARRRRQRASPALYELMRQAAAGNVEPADVIEPFDDEEVEPASTWLGPGRAVSLPTGYLLLAVAVVVVVLVSAYVIGYRRADETARQDFEEDLIASQTLSGQGVRDPLMEDTAEDSVVSPLGRPEGGLHPGFDPGRGGGGTAASDGDRSEAGGIEPPATLGPIESDPRVVGRQYWVLMETMRDGAVRLAEFGREHGLATYVVRSNNAGSRRRMVIAAPGFIRQADADAVDQLARIGRLGEAWMEAGGSTNLPDVYSMSYK